MLNKNVLSIAVLILCLQSNLFSQEKIKAKLADDYYARYSYLSAVPIYEDLATKNENNIHYLLRTAECYRLTGNITKAEEWYAKLANKESAEPSHILYYAQMLDGNKKYDEARKYYALFSEKNSIDSRAKRKQANDEQFKELFKDEQYYKVENLDFNSENSDFGLSPFGGKTFFFSSNRKNEKYVKHTYNWNNQPFLDLYTVKKNDDGNFAQPEPLPGDVNSQYHEGPLFFDKANNTFYITRNNYNSGKAQKSKDGVNKLKLFIVNIDGSAWSSFSEFPFNNNEYSIGHATLNSDGTYLYFASDMPGGIGGTDLYVSVKENDKWSEPKNLGPSINTEGNEMFPYLSADNKLYFSSDGYFGLGGLDIYSADIKGSNIENVKNLGSPINSNKDDFAFYIDDDGKSGYFSSNREGGKGDDDIYSFQILKKKYTVSGKATDKANSQILPLAKIFLVDETGEKVAETITAEDGTYSFEIEPNIKYTLKGEKENYYEGVKAFSVSEEKTEVAVDLALEKDPGLSLLGLIFDKATKQPIEGVKVVVVDNYTNAEIVNLRTPETGIFRKPITDKKLNDRISYQIKIEKEGYLGKTVTYNAEIAQPGDIKLHEALDISLDKVEVGTDIGKLININPIYFDLGKWNIRKDAASELDKIVSVMNENPTMEIELGSHTDCRGSEASNMSLSDKRAKSSAEYIKKKITNPDRISGKGYGESKLANNCECEGSKQTPCSEEEHQLNRRTEFKVLKM